MARQSQRCDGTSSTMSRLSCNCCQKSSRSAAPGNFPPMPITAMALVSTAATDTGITGGNTGAVVAVVAIVAAAVEAATAGATAWAAAGALRMRLTGGRLAP